MHIFNLVCQSLLTGCCLRRTVTAETEGDAVFSIEKDGRFRVIKVS